MKQGMEIIKFCSSCLSFEWLKQKNAYRFQTTHPKSLISTTGPVEIWHPVKIVIRVKYQGSLDTFHTVYTLPSYIFLMFIALPYHNT